MNAEELINLVDQGYSIQDLATKFGKSKTSIRHWLKKFLLTSKGRAGAKSRPTDGIHRECSKCNEFKLISEFGFRKDRNAPTSYCLKCMAKDVQDRSRATKEFYVNALGNKCTKCNDVFDASKYDFHHVAPEHKDFTIRHHKLASLTKIAAELDKCILLCANCHRHTHHEMNQENGYKNKIAGNTESWNDNKQAKLDFVNKHSCDKCGYATHTGSLGFIFKDEHKHFRKSNKRIWDDEFKLALKEASLLCLNCIRG